MKVLKIESGQIVGTVANGSSTVNNITYEWDNTNNNLSARISDISGVETIISLPDKIDVSGEQEYFVNILGKNGKFSNTNITDIFGCKYLKTIEDNTFLDASGIISFCQDGLHFLETIGSNNFINATKLNVFGDKIFPELFDICNNSFYANLFDHTHPTNPHFFGRYLPKLTTITSPPTNINNIIISDVSGVFNSSNYSSLSGEYLTEGDYVIYTKLQDLSNNNFLPHVKNPYSIPNIDRHILNSLILNETSVQNKTKIKIQASNNDIVLGNESLYYPYTTLESDFNIEKLDPSNNIVNIDISGIDLNTTGFYTPDNNNSITLKNKEGTKDIYKIEYGQKVYPFGYAIPFELYDNGRLNNFNGHFIFRGSILVIHAVADPCFLKDSLVLTNKGYVKIQDINPKIHTIKNKQIQCVTKTIYPHTQLVCIEKDAIKHGIPSQRTYITGKHKIYYKEKMIRAQNLVSHFHLKNVYMVPYNGDILYNILMENHEKMKVNNMLCETLHPMNEMACIYSKYSNYTEAQKSKIIYQLNKYQIDNNEEEHKNLLRTLRCEEKLQRSLQTKKFFTHV